MTMKACRFLHFYNETIRSVVHGKATVIHIHTILMVKLEQMNAVGFHIEMFP
jgi:hypothetical protein